MIQDITIVNHLNEAIKLPLSNPYETGFGIMGIDGLGPVKANLNFTEIVTLDGAIDNSARLTKRNIVLNLRFFPCSTIEAASLKTYQFFTPKKSIKFKITTDRRSCETVGRIESNEPNIFSKEEGCKITIVCADPYFYSCEDTETLFYGTKAMFEFPFSNEDLKIPLLEMGTITKRRTEETIYYYGDSETGITIRLKATGPISGLVIYKTQTRESFTIDDERLTALLGEGFKEGDVLTINTNKRQKSVTLFRDGETHNIINTIRQPITWFELDRGENTFIYTATNGIANVELAIYNKVLYEGV